MIDNINNGLIIFGGTGDLAKRKLFPAIYNLAEENQLPDDFFVIGVGRRDLTRDEYIQYVEEAIKEHSRTGLDNNVWDKAKSRIYYHKLNFVQNTGYMELGEYIVELENIYKTNGHLLFFLAVSPEYFGDIVTNLRKYEITDINQSNKKIMVEKPFGHDLLSASKLNNEIVKTFKEENIYRVDHYLGKEMLQNIMVIRFANAFFEPIWNSKYIDHVQITSSETLGVGNRGNYYENSGALKDMLQNHLLQFLAITTMEPPKDLDMESIRDEKVRVIKSLKLYKKDEVTNNVIRGQYGDNEDESIQAYRKEPNVDDNSDTETYIAIKAEINNERWAGVPFYIRTGKRMKSKCINVTIEFKSLYKHLIFGDSDNHIPNKLIISIQPREGINLEISAKEPGQKNDIVPIKMEFCQSCAVGYNSTEAYERLLLGAMRSDKTLFTRWDEVEYSWRFIDSIQDAWRNEKPNFPNYAGNSNGPKAAEELLTRDNRKWFDNNISCKADRN